MKTILIRDAYAERNHFEKGIFLRLFSENFYVLQTDQHE